MAAFGGQSGGPSQNVCGGDLWEAPCQPEPRWYHYVFATLALPFQDMANFLLFLMVGLASFLIYSIWF